MWTTFPDGDNPETVVQHINLKSVIGIKAPYKNDVGCLLRLNNGDLVPVGVAAGEVLERLRPWWQIW